MSKHTLLSIDHDALAHVDGGQLAAPVQAPVRAPVQLELPLPKPFTAPPNMGFPKYSAGWWDLVRARGLFK